MAINTTLQTLKEGGGKPALNTAEGRVAQSNLYGTNLAFYNCVIGGGAVAAQLFDLLKREQDTIDALLAIVERLLAVAPTAFVTIKRGAQWEK